jgi:hypothetical protein
MALVKESQASTVTKGLGGTFGGLFEGVAAGLDIHEGVKDAEEGKTGRGVAEVTKGGTGIVGAGAEWYETAAEMFKSANPESKEFFEKQAHGANIASSAMSAVGDGIQGFMDLADGRDEYRNGKGVEAKSGGMTKMVKGGAETGAAASEGGLALMGADSLGWDAVVTRAALSSAPKLLGTAAPVLSSFATGLEMGHAMEGITKNSGLLKDDQGRNENGSDRTSRWSESAAEGVDGMVNRVEGWFGGGDKKPHAGHTVLGDVAGGVTSIVTSPVGAIMDAAGTVDSGYNWLKKKL